VAALNPQDEFIHPTGTDESWREAFYFDFYDPKTKLAAFGYSGVHPNQETGDVIFALWRGDVLLAKYTRWDLNIPREIGEERLDFGPLAFRPIDPYKKWRMFYDDGAARVDLTFDAIHPAYNWGQSHAALAQTNSHHYEQQGRYSGTIRVAGERHDVTGIGARDHAWGWGARAGIRRWVWASAQFSERFAWNMFQITLADQREIHYGYIYRGGENILLRRSHAQLTYAEMGKAPQSGAFALEAVNGDKVQASCRMLNAFNTSHQERNKTGFHYFSHSEFQCEGQTGYGQTNVHWRLEADRPKDWGIITEK